MRITDNLFSDFLKYQLQVLQQAQFTDQQQISTGLRFTQPSDDPVDFELAQEQQTNGAGINAFLKTVSDAQSQAQVNYQAMTSLQTAIGRAAEVATSTNGTRSTSDMQASAQEINGILAQAVNIANQQYNGNYLFGGTSTSQPINSSTYAYQGNSTAQTAELQQNYTFTTGIIAGGTPAVGPTVDGFLYNAAKGVDVINVLRTFSADLQAGNLTAIQTTDTTNLNKAMDHVSEYVGLTATQLKAIELSRTTLQQQQQTNNQQLSSNTSASLTDAITSLNQVQTDYRAALQSGARVLGLNLLDFLK